MHALKTWRAPLTVVLAGLLLAVALVALLAGCGAVPVRNQIQAAANTASAYAERTTALLNQKLITIEEAEARLAQLRRTQTVLLTARATLTACDVNKQSSCDGATLGLNAARNALSEYEVYLLAKEQASK